MADQVLLVLHLVLGLLQQRHLGVLSTPQLGLQAFSLLLSSLPLLLQLQSPVCLLLQLCTDTQSHTERSAKGKHHRSLPCDDKLSFNTDGSPTLLGFLRLLLDLL